MVEDGRRDGPPWLDLMEEVGIGPIRRLAHFALWAALILLAVAAVITSVVGIFVGAWLVETGVGLLVAAVVLMVVTTWWRRFLVRKVRWVAGTVTFRTIVPGDTSEDGQLVTCRVRVNPPSPITQVSTRVGPLDAERLAVGGKMRCLIDRLDTHRPLRVFPYATPEAALPSGRELKFRKV